MLRDEPDSMQGDPSLKWNDQQGALKRLRLAWADTVEFYVLVNATNRQVDCPPESGACTRLPAGRLALATEPMPTINTQKQQHACV